MTPGRLFGGRVQGAVVTRMYRELSTTAEDWGGAEGAHRW